MIRCGPLKLISLLTNLKINWLGTLLHLQSLVTFVMQHNFIMGVISHHVHRPCPNSGQGGYSGHVHQGAKILGAMLDFCLLLYLIQSCAPYWWGYVLRNASLGDFIVCEHDRMYYTNLDDEAYYTLGYMVQPIPPRLQACAVCYCTEQLEIKLGTREMMPSRQRVKHTILGWPKGLFAL